MSGKGEYLGAWSAAASLGYALPTTDEYDNALLWRVAIGYSPLPQPHYNTYRRILAHVVYEEEIAKLVGAYNHRGEHGEVYAMDGKTLRGTRKKDEEGSEYLLSVYDVEQAKVMSQVAVGRKENEITKAPEVLKKVEIARKIITADALHTQKALSTQIINQGGDYVFPVKENQLRLYQNIQQLFALEYPKPGFGKIQMDFLKT